VLAHAPLLQDLALTFDAALLRNKPAGLSSVLTKLYFHYDPLRTNGFDVELLASYPRIRALKELSVREDTYETIRLLIVTGMGHLIASLHLNETLSYGSGEQLADYRVRELYLWQHCLHIKRLIIDYALLPMRHGSLPRLHHLQIFFSNGYQPDVTYLVSEFLAKCPKLRSITFLQDTVCLADELDDVATVIMHRQHPSELSTVTLCLSEKPDKDLVEAAAALQGGAEVAVHLNRAKPVFIDQ
jgi:hypothetical protein